jgi:hypothetical protein
MSSCFGWKRAAETLKVAKAISLALASEFVAELLREDGYSGAAGAALPILRSLNGFRHTRACTCRVSLLFDLLFYAGCKY